MPPFFRGPNNRCTPNWCTFSHVLLLQIVPSINTYNPNDIQSVVWNSGFYLSYHIQEIFKTIVLPYCHPGGEISCLGIYDLKSAFESFFLQSTEKTTVFSLPLMHIASTQRTCPCGLLKTDMTELCQLRADQKWMCNSGPGRLTSLSLMSWGWSRALITPAYQTSHCHNQTRVVMAHLTEQGENSWENFQQHKMKANYSVSINKIIA